ncbi:MAG: hypothetical protein R3C17_17705 [Planctomycetaceae bacterium]
MSDTVSSATPATESQAELFSPVEIEQFGADDVTAGGAIGKMLSALFLYTVFAMGIAGWWTYTSINADKAAADAGHDGHAAEHQHSSESAH